MFVMVFVVEIIRISVMVSIVFVSRVTMGFVMLFAINATGLLQYCEICDCLYCSCGGPIWEKIQGRFLLPVRPWTHPSICLSIHLSIHLSIYTYLLSVYLPFCLIMYCDDSSAAPLLSASPRPLIAALHQAPDGSGCVREEGRWNSHGWRRVMGHTWSEWSLITAPVKCRARLSCRGVVPRACTLVSSWV